VSLAIHTLEEAAAILRVKASWLERQAAARKIPFTMLGGSYRFTADHLATIVTQHENRPVSAAPSAPEQRPHKPRVTTRLNDSPATPLRPRSVARRRPAA
jgi:excisionase family DNA binding protein